MYKSTIIILKSCANGNNIFPYRKLRIFARILCPQIIYTMETNWDVSITQQTLEIDVMKNSKKISQRLIKSRRRLDMTCHVFRNIIEQCNT